MKECNYTGCTNPAQVNGLCEECNNRIWVDDFLDEMEESKIKRND